MNQASDIPSSWNLPFVEELQAEFARDPASIAPEWRRYFAGLKNGEPAAAPRPEARPAASPLEETAAAGKIATLQERVHQLVRNYRVRGHNNAALDPLGLP